MTTHGHSRNGKGVARLHYIWSGMRQRCLNPKNDKFQHYGGRGISVCEAWSDFDSFRAWALANGYQDSLSIDRIDNDGNYEPGNCRWVTHTIQTRNRSISHLLTHNGETKTLSEWARDLGICNSALRGRLKKWPVEDALTRPKA